MLRVAPVRVLDDRDLPAVRMLCARDPVAHVFLRSRVDAWGLESWRLGAEVWGHQEHGRLAAVCYSGANLVPAEAGPAALTLFADRARRQGRHCSSIVGPADQVAVLWGLLEPVWGPARAVRGVQPVLELSADPYVRADPAVRLARPDEVDALLPAAVAMFTEEVGVSPLAAGGGPAYRARLAELVAAGRALVRLDGDGRVVFKAEIGALGGGVAQIQGVWTDPEQRGRGVATAGMAAVVAFTRRYLAPVVTLYVNDFNVPARQAYQRVGFREVGTFRSVLF